MPFAARVTLRMGGTITSGAGKRTITRQTHQDPSASLGRPEDKRFAVGGQRTGRSEIFYSGMLCDLESYAESITVCVDPRLVPLFQRSFERMTFISKPMLSPDKPFDAHIHMGSLGALFAPQR